MIIRLIIALTCMCLLGTSCSSSDDRDARPLRADCIVRIYFDPSEGVRDVSPDAIFYAHYNLGLPVGGVARAKNGDIYVQFEQNCESRVGMARSMMEQVFGPSVDGINYQEEGNRPGLDTISVQGDMWRD